VAANLILTNGRFTTLDARNPSAEAVAIAGGRFIAVGSAEEIGAHRDPRTRAIDRWTERNSWFSNEEREKGRIEAGQLADLAVLSRDYFSVADSDIQDIEAVLTLLGGKVVYGAEEFSGLGPSLPPAMPDWSPVRTFGGYQSSAPLQKHACAMHRHARALPPTLHDPNDFWGALGCSCWAF
jgi:hypothetical protein